MTNNTIHTLTSANVNDYLRRVRAQVLGSDALFNQFDNIVEGTGGFPPYNLEAFGDDTYKLTLAVAGFSKDEIDINIENGTLNIAGMKTQRQTGDFLHRGLAERNFTRSFRLMEFVEVIGSYMADGLLVISLKKVIPEALKPKKIEISSPAEYEKIFEQSQSKSSSELDGPFISNKL